MRLPLDPGGARYRPAALTDFTAPVPGTRLDRMPQVQPLDLRPWPDGGRAGQAPRGLLDLMEVVDNLRDES